MADNKEKSPITVMGKDYLNQKFYNQKEAATRINVDVKTIERWRMAGLLHYHQEGSVIRISEQQLLDCLRHIMKNQTLDLNNLSPESLKEIAFDLDPANEY